MNKKLLSYILAYPHALLQRHTLIDLFTLTDRHLFEVKDGLSFLPIETEPFEGMLISDGTHLHVLTSFKEVDYNLYQIQSDSLYIPVTNDVLCRPTDKFILSKGDILNYKEDTPIETTLGRFIINYVLLVDPFGDLIPYQNQTFKGAGALEKLISENILLGKITAPQERTYGANLLYLTSNPEYFAPTLTKKVLTTGANVKARKKELLEKYAKEIANGDVVTIAKIEEELVQMDKDYCKGDPSKLFLMKGSYFSNIRKKLFIIHGAVPRFGGNGDYDFIPNSLEEGYTVKDFPKIANEIRDGTYSRSTLVAKGGDQSNFILRIFQNTRITELDCGTNHGLPIKIHENNYKDYIDRNFFDNHGHTVNITPQLSKTLIGQSITVRSPMYCKAKDGGTCYRCTDKRFEETKQDTLATIMNTLGAMFSTLALKKVHNTAVSSTRLKDIDTYLL